MKYELVEVNKHFELQKGISYTSKELVDESETGLLTINAFTAGGGFKLESEKPYGGDLKPDYLLSDGDVLLAMTEQDAGLLASPLTIKSDYSKFSNLTFSLDVARVISTSGEVDPNFLYNVLRIPAFRERAAYGDTGSTVQRLPYEAFGELKIPCPPLDVQRAIVQIIDDIDSKIYLNKQTSESLEQIAQTIFKSWFVDYEPVQAKARGEQPEGMDAEIAALFPDSFEDSELGPVMLGSAVSTVGEALDLSWGDTKTTKSSYIETGYPAFSAKGQDGYLKKFDYNQTGVVLSAIGAGCGVSWLASGKWSCIKNTIRIIAKPEKPNALFYFYFLTRNPDFWPKSGSAQPFIGQEDARSVRIVLPPQNVLREFDKIVEPVFAQVKNLQTENQTLARIRDSLLPRLISGELEIPEELLGE